MLLQQYPCVGAVECDTFIMLDYDDKKRGIKVIPDNISCLATHNHSLKSTMAFTNDTDPASESESATIDYWQKVLETLSIHTPA